MGLHLKQGVPINMRIQDRTLKSSSLCLIVDNEKGGTIIHIVPLVSFHKCGLHPFYVVIVYSIKSLRNVSIQVQPVHYQINQDTIQTATIS